MRIESIKIKNFRQFFDENQIEFCNSITVIHGVNGSGKTSLLNAFKWAFYGHTDFDTKEKNILNEQSIACAEENENIPMNVTVTFEHNGYIYTAKREQLFTKLQGMVVEPLGSHVFELSWIAPDGGFDKSNNPENQMNQILPEKMHSYFFFNGERIEKLANPSASHQIRDAIKTLMGVEIVSRTSEHLNNYVIKFFRKELKDKSAGELDDIIDDENRIQDDISLKTNEIAINKENMTQYQEEIKAIYTWLTKNKESKKLQERRQSIDNRLEKIKDELCKNSQDILSQISNQGFLAFFDETSKSIYDLLEEKRRKGELPYKIKQQFIDDLLSNQMCFCKRPLLPGENPFIAVKNFKDSLGEADLENAFNETTGDLRFIKERRNIFFKELRALISKKKGLIEEKEILNGKLDSISSEISNLDFENGEDLEEKRANYINLSKENLRNEGKLNAELLEIGKER